MNFELILTVLVIISGVITLWDQCVLRKRRKKQFEKQKLVDPHHAEAVLKLPLIIEYARSFFPVLLIVLLIRSFVIQPFRVPTGSLEPTILPGDFIAVNQYAYGLRLPVLHSKIWAVGEPKRGDIVVFRYPPNPRVNYVKRVVGMPGDKLSYINKVLYINGKPMIQKTIGDALDIEPDVPIPVIEKEENLNGVKHHIFVRPNYISSGNFYNIVVPKGQYFMMGDNRDNSIDSRAWGFMPEKNIIGKAFFTWLSWDSQAHRFRWDHLGSLQSDNH